MSQEYIDAKAHFQILGLVYYSDDEGAVNAKNRGSFERFLVATAKEIGASEAVDIFFFYTEKSSDSLKKELITLLTNSLIEMELSKKELNDFVDLISKEDQGDILSEYVKSLIANKFTSVGLDISSINKSEGGNKYDSHDQEVPNINAAGDIYLPFDSE